MNWAQTIGHQTAGLVQAILAARPHPEHSYRSCLGITRLSRLYSADRLEAAAARALACRAFSYRSLKSILEAGLDKVPVVHGEARAPVPEHANLRGAAYFAGEKAGCLPC